MTGTGAASTPGSACCSSSFCMLCDAVFWRDEPPQVVAILIANLPAPRRNHQFGARVVFLAYEDLAAAANPGTVSVGGSEQHLTPRPR